MRAQSRETVRSNGPYNGSFIADGLGLTKPLLPDAPLGAKAPWSMYCWVRARQSLPEHTLIAGVGNLSASGEAGRFFAVVDGKLALWAGNDHVLTTSAAALNGNAPHLLVVTFDGTTMVLYSDGAEVARRPFTLSQAAATAQLAPVKMPWANGRHFAGTIAEFTLVDHALSADEVRALASHAPDFDLIAFEEGSKSWPVQTRAQAGYRAPQNPDTLPKASAAFSKPVAKPGLHAAPELAPRGSNIWAIAGGWRLLAAPEVSAAGDQISRPGFQAANWYNATVPGTVLTTLIDRGVYPDPDYGLNNLAIPEKLNKQDYWYRTEFTLPASLQGRRLTLTFHGINYAAAVWLNGKRVGNIKGAFIRGIFDVTDLVMPGQPSALAIRISPPPHPGIPHEQSVKGGPGENGGALCLDGPTFIAAEGWDWIPGIRDRNIGLWQEVTLSAAGFVKLGDPRVVTKLPLPNTNTADISIGVPLRNESNATVQGSIHASFEGVEVTKNVALPPGESVVSLQPSEFRQLSLANPRLWWPNGYGSPELYHLKLSFTGQGGENDGKDLRFGIREITYELSLMDRAGQLRRVEFSPVNSAGEQIVDTSHEGIIQSAQGWVYSLTAGAEKSTAIRVLDDLKLTPYLVIRVNGVRIACKGGNWGMDDSRKRVSREKLEPYFRLHRDANLNIIRNWCGQNTEEVFYELADEYGLLVWNDFWQSTQNYNVEPSDTALFLTNARDTISRYRNHPSIVVWCGRNEGVPAPAVNTGLDQLIRELDNTRFYAPSSNVVNLQNSGPYKYDEPESYFTKYALGFAVELGVPSVPTLDAIRAMMPPADQWPLNDTWAYHDWHQSGNGVVAPFMAALSKEFGAASSLEDFERKAQMMNYVIHRAIFEGFNAGLWTSNSGRLLWMTQPAWPSTMWQILSSDYDTQSSFYGVKKACERVHVQMNLPDLKTAVVNNSADPLENLSLQTQVLSLDGKVVSTKTEKINAPPNSEIDSAPVQVSGAGLVFIKLSLTNAPGTLLSENFYWYARDDSNYRQLNQLPAVKLAGSVTQARSGDSVRINVEVTNADKVVALMSKLTLRSGVDGQRILPAYYSDNYVSLLPGEKRQIQIECPAAAVKDRADVELSGWNVSHITIHAASAKN